MFANYHTHTARCGHATGTDREYIEAAIRSGIKVLGFSDHCPWIFPDGHISPTRMLPGQFDDYFTSLTALRDEYAHDITIYIGLESEYLPELMEAQDRFLDGYPLDYMILGQHYLRREPLSPYTGRQSSSAEDLERYVDLIIEGMNTGRYTYVAHPDLFYFTGDAQAYHIQMSRLCTFFKERNLPVEINMLGAAAQRNYPCEQFLAIAQSTGNYAIIGADAHSPDVLESCPKENLCVDIANRFQLPIICQLPGLGPRH